MKIAFLGNRGIPANFGGSDTVFEHLGQRLVKKGHYIVVYCRKHFSNTDDEFYKGMERVILPSINRLNFDTLTHSFLSTLHVLFNDKVEILNYHGIGNSLLLPLLIFSRKKSVVVVDGPDWKRPKWSLIAKIALRLSVYFALLLADEIISDNIPMHNWFKKKYNKNTSLIFYGTDFNKVPPGEHLAKWRLKGNDYILFVAMMVPDKGPDIVLEAYSRIKTDKKLLMVGDTHYHKEFFTSLKTKYSGNPNIIFTGFQYGNSYKEFMSNAHIYVHPFRSDGTSPSLIQAMAYRNCILANDLAETKAALRDAGIMFSKNSSLSLAEKLQFLLSNPQLIEYYRNKSLEAARKFYDWENITDQYEVVFAGLYSNDKRGAFNS